MRLHHDKHHATYFKATNEILQQPRLRADSLEDVVLNAKRSGDAKLFHNAAQAWNHTFFWICMSPARQSPDGDLAVAIDQAFGGLDKLRKRFVEEGVAHFGSG